MLIRDSWRFVWSLWYELNPRVRCAFGNDLLKNWMILKQAYLGEDQWEGRLLQFHIWKHQYQYWEFIFFSRYFLVVLLMEHSENFSISISKGLFGTHSIFICKILSISNFLAEHQYLESIPDTIPGAPSYSRRTWMRSLLLAPWTSGHMRGAVMKMTHERNHWGHLRSFHFVFPLGDIQGFTLGWPNWPKV